MLPYLSFHLAYGLLILVESLGCIPVMQGTERRQTTYCRLCNNTGMMGDDIPCSCPWGDAYRNDQTAKAGELGSVRTPRDLIKACKGAVWQLLAHLFSARTS